MVMQWLIANSLLAYAVSHVCTLLLVYWTYLDAFFSES
jgi:hypothetical protein